MFRWYCGIWMFFRLFLNYELCVDLLCYDLIKKIEVPLMGLVGSLSWHRVWPDGLMVGILKKNDLYLSWFFYFAIFSEYLNTNLTILIFLNFTFLGFGLVFIKGKLFEIPLLAPCWKKEEYFLIADHSLFLTLSLWV